MRSTLITFSFLCVLQAFAVPLFNGSLGVCVCVHVDAFSIFMDVHQGCVFNNSMFISFAVSVAQLSVFSTHVDWKALPAVRPGAIQKPLLKPLQRQRNGNIQPD